MFKNKIGTWIILLAFLLNAAFLSAQEEGSTENDENTDPAIESDWTVFDVPSYERGDNMLGMGFGLLFPAFFTGKNGASVENNVNLGGIGFLSYDKFIASNFALGAEINFSFNSTLGENMLYLVPMGLRFTYQLVLHPIEIPFSMTVGMVPQIYLDENYLGLYLKPSLGVFWRFNADWSFGVNGSWMWLPEWTKNPAETVYGNFVALTITARHHF